MQLNAATARQLGIYANPNASFLPNSPAQPRMYEADAASQADHARRLDYGNMLSESRRWRQWVGRIQEPEIRANTAIMLETTKRWLDYMRMDETTRIFHVGNFDKFAFPLVRAVFPNLIANDVVSVQPMAGPVSLIFYLDFLFGSDKGQISAGTSAFDALVGPDGNQWFSHDIIDRETVGTGDGSTTAFLANLAYTPIRPGSVSIEATISSTLTTIRDDGNGAFLGSGLSSGSINYNTGALSATFATAPDAATTIFITYEYNSEASDLIPQMDMQLTSASVTARSRKLRARWSLEAAQNLNALHSIDAEAELIAVLAERIKFEIDQEIINDLWDLAPGDTSPSSGLGLNQNTVVFTRTIPSGISWTEYKLQFVDHVVEGGNRIFSRTRRGTANFMVVDVNAANILETLPSFSYDAGSADAVGVVFIGTLNNKWKVYKDPYLSTFITRHGSTITNQVGAFLMGYKGTSFIDAGYVYAPYIPLYSTPTVVLDDFISRKGMATQYGKRKINENYYVRGYVVS